MFAGESQTEDMAAVRAFLMDERAKVLSDAEWRFRMRGYGYDLRRTDRGIMVKHLPRDQLLGLLAV